MFCGGILTGIGIMLAVWALLIIGYKQAMKAANLSGEKA